MPVIACTPGTPEHGAAIVGVPTGSSFRCSDQPSTLRHRSQEGPTRMYRFFKPEHARLGDTIPFYYGGQFHVFYLKRYADDTHDRIETDWWQLTSTDLVDFTDIGPAIPRGGPTDPDFSAATGSVIRIGHEFHAYYTGFSEWNRRNGGRNQTVLRARSTDLLTWTKDPEFALVSDEMRYDRHEWRDPFVFWDDDAGLFRMLIAAQANHGPVGHSGVTAQATSPDGHVWTVQEPLWAPNLFSMHECPDLFRMGDYWYLVYSTLTDRTVTRYRMSRTLAGPWTAPADDELDGLGMYAAKTVTDGDHRYLVGWCPNYAAGKDGAPWLWGGNLIVHQLSQAPDGRLLVSQPAGARRILEQRTDQPVTAIDPVTIDAAGSYRTATLTAMPHAGVLDVTIVPTPGTKAFGIELRVDADRAHGYSVTFEPPLHRIVVDRLDRFGAEAPFDVRPLAVDTAETSLVVEFDGEVVVVYVNGEVAITFRGYDISGRDVAVFAREGSVDVRRAALHSLQSESQEDR